MDVGRVGIWNGALRSAEPGEAGEAAFELEELGYGAIWLGASPSVEEAAPVLAATSRIVVATGILNIWQHTPAAVAAARAELPNADRFLLGIGASHAPLVEGYHKPYSAMVDYLDGLDAADPSIPPAGRVLAALGPRMLELSRDRAAGAHPYLVTPDSTRQARERLGTGPLLAPEVKVILESDRDRAHAIARKSIAMYLTLPNYTNNFRRFGFGDDDFESGGSDRLLDAIFVWGDQDTVRRGIEAFFEAGADHVAVQALAPDGAALPRDQWRELSALLDLA
jgi:probable F420-dependent oxidoreductase